MQEDGDLCLCDVLAYLKHLEQTTRGTQSLGWLSKWHHLQIPTLSGVRMPILTLRGSLKTEKGLQHGHPWPRAHAGSLQGRHLPCGLCLPWDQGFTSTEGAQATDHHTQEPWIPKIFSRLPGGVLLGCSLVGPPWTTEHHLHSASSITVWDLSEELNSTLPWWMTFSTVSNAELSICVLAPFKYICTCYISLL